MHGTDCSCELCRVGPISTYVIPTDAERALPNPPLPLGADSFFRLTEKFFLLPDRNYRVLISFVFNDNLAAATNMDQSSMQIGLFRGQSPDPAFIAATRFEDLIRSDLCLFAGVCNVSFFLNVPQLTELGFIKMSNHLVISRITPEPVVYIQGPRG